MWYTLFVAFLYQHESLYQREDIFTLVKIKANVIELFVEEYNAQIPWPRPSIFMDFLTNINA